MTFDWSYFAGLALILGVWGGLLAVIWFTSEQQKVRKVILELSGEVKVCEIVEIGNCVAAKWWPLLSGAMILRRNGTCGTGAIVFRWKIVDAPSFSSDENTVWFDANYVDPFGD